MGEGAGEFAGLTQDEAEGQIVERLDELGLLVSREPYEHSVGTCERCGSRIEPLLSEQWFCDMEELARPAIEAVESGRVRFHPEQQGAVYLEWMRKHSDRGASHASSGGVTAFRCGIARSVER